MMTPEQIKALSDKFQIDQFSILREYIQLIFLKYLYQIKESQHIWFKGGTAIHFLFGSFRFSEDLDFTTTIDTATIKKILHKAIKKAEKAIKQETLIPSFFIKAILSLKQETFSFLPVE